MNNKEDRVEEKNSSTATLMIIQLFCMREGLREQRDVVACRGDCRGLIIYVSVGRGFVRAIRKWNCPRIALAIIVDCHGNDNHPMDCINFIRTE